MKYKSLTIILFLCLSGSISAQSVIRSSQSDSSVIDQLDRLMSTWYAKKAVYHENSLVPFAEKECPYTHPDSIMIYRLQKLTNRTLFPMVFNEDVRSFINMYIRKNRQVSLMSGLAKYYFPMFEQTLDKYNCPLELKYLAVIESALNPVAVSRAGATGLWQFMYGTGKMYGLEVTTMVDYRCDPLRSTDAAARHLKDLSDMFWGDWVLALAAYNCGPGNVKKAIARSGGKTDFWEIYNYLPKETRGYVPAFYGAWYVMSYYDKYGIEPAEVRFGQVDTFLITNKLHFEQIASVLNIPVEEIKALNPQYKRNIIPLSEDAMYLILPVEYTIAYEMNKDSIYRYETDKYFSKPSISLSREPLVSASGDYKLQTRTHTVKSGESLSVIARKYRTTSAQLAKLNKISVNTTIHPGKKLIVGYNKIPVPKPKPAPVDSIATPNTAASDSLLKAKTNQIDLNNELQKVNAKEYVIYRVMSGDTLFSIAERYEHVTVSELKKINRLEKDDLEVGQSLKIPVF
ncbi:MAG: LysM peptidoglycan-binding domain-containing protein [Bacteroidales bacterium]|jgi:membrane-bound lytic murein transglycosylase D|nr:LysM peptidoglycan-binding domain-containing protein [Bacteroidales bacterium]